MTNDEINKMMDGMNTKVEILKKELKSHVNVPQFYSSKDNHKRIILKLEAIEAILLL